MAERPPINFVSIVANIIRGPVAANDEAAAEMAVAVLGFLEDGCDETGAEPGTVAHLTILDLTAGLIAFGGVRNVEELTEWLRQEAPSRACELTKAMSVDAHLGDAMPCRCLSTPQPAAWH